MGAPSTGSVPLGPRGLRYDVAGHRHTLERSYWFKNFRCITSRAGKSLRIADILLQLPSTAVLEQIVEDGVEPRGPLAQLLLLLVALRALLEQLIGNIEGGEDGHL